MPAHPVPLDAIRARRLGLLHLFRQPPDISREDRGDDLDLAHWPGAARSINHRAPEIVPQGTAPCLAWETASAFPAPVARMIPRRALCSAGRVSVTRCGGGFGESRMPTTSADAFSAGWPGKRDAVCPS